VTTDTARMMISAILLYCNNKNAAILRRNW